MKEKRLDSFDDGIRNIYGVQAEAGDKSSVQHHRMQYTYLDIPPTIILTFEVLNIFSLPTYYLRIII